MASVSFRFLDHVCHVCLTTKYGMSTSTSPHSKEESSKLSFSCKLLNLSRLESLVSTMSCTVCVAELGLKLCTCNLANLLSFHPFFLHFY